MVHRFPDDERVADVTWETPPKAGVKYDWEAIAEKLKAEPMTWAKVFENDRASVVNAIRQGSIKAVRPEAGFQVKTAHNVRLPIRTCTLYMRYVPALDKTRRRGR